MTLFIIEIIPEVVTVLDLPAHEKSDHIVARPLREDLLIETTVAVHITPNAKLKNAHRRVGKINLYPIPEEIFQKIFLPHAHAHVHDI